MKHKEVIVIHDESSCEFFVNLSSFDLGDGKAVLKYQINKGNSIDFYQTFVPRLARGRGIAEALVEQGLAWARDRNYELHASCWYVEKYLRSS